MKIVEKKIDELIPYENNPRINEYGINALADNKTAELSTWDFEKLEKELSEIKFDMSLFEFDEKELSKEFDKLKTVEEDDFDVVLDLFGGSGTTLIACENLNRKCRMLELDEKNCDIIIQRYEELTGNKAELVK